ncbi:lycopene cyclase family protein [Winogradskyella sp. SYSU M77433]|uniref:lycopene cyclase family protein n=1 Tax=Winogradskyella sp. SYSU M77433 TaxID=3042722 RepID=UPI00248114AE|nr:lycopene cyclase family protein [Winogradskyella sp. SYSU M77433]MDH7914393.1 lycopene cyclase family protein [Winogradskyella sp. SYSU M77433]
MNKYDYIILGAGASGLMLAYRMSQDEFFDDKSILIIDKIKNKGDDRTWCYWEENKGEWDHLLTQKWKKIFFGSKDFSETIEINPYQYKMIRSSGFYDFLWTSIHLKSNFSFFEDTVESFKEVEDAVEVITKTSTFTGCQLFNSLPNLGVYDNQVKYPVLQQHFLGWFIETSEETFDDSVATFMDFKVPQKCNTRFMYILPISKKQALFEYTLFSKELLDKSEYEEAIEAYLKQRKISDYTIVEKEIGAIPMTAFDFSKLNSNHILNIGTAGGWTKASTGYTFKNTTKKTIELVAYLKINSDLSKFANRTRHTFYDTILLDVLANHNGEGAAIFSSMFKKADVKTIFKFLDEESSLWQELKVVLSVPKKRFIQAFIKRLF